ncbi:MAG TPA: M48 family metalloprotease, partial [Egibacteraceae bacterium]|nr:M48 family metalloprotease [Egibacteraceae bacterium]
MVQAAARVAAGASSPGRRFVRMGFHGVAGLVVAAGVAAQVLRPLAPDLGPAPPPTAWFDAAHLAHVHAYRRPLYAVGAVVLVLRLTLPCLVAFTRTGGRLVDRVVRRVGEGRPARAAAVVVLAAVISADVLVLPLAFWTGYLHEGAFGFRTQGPAGWTYDWLVDKVPVWLVVGGLVLSGYGVARRLPRAWPPVAGLGAAAFTVLLVFASPLVLQPLIFDTKPVPPGPLRTEVERVLAASGQDVDRIVIADASRRTTKRNARISGLGASRRVVLYDTLLQSHPVDEVGLVLAHEASHARNADLVRGALGRASLVDAPVALGTSRDGSAMGGRAGGRVT